MKKSEQPGSKKPSQLRQQNLLAALCRNEKVLQFKPFRRQVGALCFRFNRDSAPEFLLQTSRETRRWVIPKGWEMDEKTPSKAAEIEAFEEAGVIGRADQNAFGTYCYLKALKDGSEVPVMVDVFLVRVTRLSKDFKEKGQRKVQWFSAVEAAQLVNEPQLSTMFIRAAQSIT